MDQFSLIRGPNPTKVKTGSRPRAPHEVSLLTLTAARVIKMDEPAATTDSSGVPSAVEKSPLDFAHEDGASDQGTTAPEVPPPEDVSATAAPEVGQSEGVVVAEPPVARESRKRGHDGIDASAPPKLLRRDHADQPSGSSHGGKSLAAMQICMASNVFVSESAPADVSDPDQLSFADAPSHHPVNFAHVYRPEWGVTNGSLLETPEACQDLVDHAAPGLLFRAVVAMGSQLRLRFEQEAKLLRKSVAQVARRDQRIQARELEIKNLEALLETEVDALQRQLSGEETLKAAFEDYKRQQDQMAFADVVSAGVAKGMSEGLKHGHAQLTVESLEAYDPEAEAKFAAALQSLKDLKYPLLDQLEGLKDAPMDVIMAALYLESDTGGMPHNLYATSALVPLSLPSLYTRRSDGVSVFVPTVVPQGLAYLLVDAATQTDFEDA
nr:hypothetical protein [Tanacetum cinerariifolium]